MRWTFQRAGIICIMKMTFSTPKILIVYGLDKTTFFQVGVLAWLVIYGNNMYLSETWLSMIEQRERYPIGFVCKGQLTYLLIQYLPAYKNLEFKNLLA
jgi:hypothetical protein